MNEPEKGNPATELPGDQSEPENPSVDQNGEPELARTKINLAPYLGGILLVAILGGLGWWLFGSSPPAEFLKAVEAPQGPLLKMLLNQDQQAIYLGTAAGDVIRFSLADEKFTPLPHQLDEPITSLALSSDDFLIAGNYGNLLPGWDISQEPAPGQLGPFPARINCIAIHPLRLELTAGTDSGQLMLLTATKNEKKITRRKTGHVGSIKEVRYSPNGLVLVSAGSDGNLIWYGGEGWQQISIQKGHSSEIGALQFSPDGKLLASGDWDGNITLWDVATRKEKQAWKQADAVACFAWHGNLLITGSWDGRLRFWSLQQGVMTHEINTGSPILDLCVLPEAHQVVTISHDNLVRFWDISQIPE